MFHPLIFSALSQVLLNVILKEISLNGGIMIFSGYQNNSSFGIYF